MYKTLRKESLRHVLPRLVVCLCLAVALFAVSGSGLVRLLMGPAELSDLSLDEMDGRYVSFDASEVVVAFATLSVSNSDGDSKTLKTYYLLPVGDGSYMAVMDARESNVSLLERAMEQSEEYYLGDLETLTTMGAISGTVTALDDDMVDYMTECIENYELPGYEEGSDSAALIVSYQVELDYLGAFKKPVVLALGIAGLVFLLLFVVQLVIVLAGCYQRQVRRIVGDGADEEDFQSSVRIERNRVGKYILYTKGAGSRALETQDIIWGYTVKEPMVVSKYRWPVALYDTQQNATNIFFKEQGHCQDFLNAIAARCNPFIMGYSSENARKFQSDIQGFKKDAEQAAEERKNPSEPAEEPEDTEE